MPCSSPEADRLWNAISALVKACGGTPPEAGMALENADVADALALTEKRAAEWAETISRPIRQATMDAAAFDELATDAIFLRIAKRYRGLLLVGVVDLDANRESSFAWWHGGVVQALGLVQVAQQRLEDVRRGAGLQEGGPG